MEWCREHVHERAAIPKHLEILPELPKTAVGKIFKPELRKRAITRVYDAVLGGGRGCLSAWSRCARTRSLASSRAWNAWVTVEEEAVRKVLGEYTRPWEWRHP